MHCTKNNHSPSQHQESKKQELPFDHRKVTKVAAARLDQVRKICEHVNADIMISPGSQSDTETLPTVDTSTTPLVSDDYTLDSFLSQNKGVEGCKEIKQSPHNNAGLRKKQEITNFNKSKSAPLPFCNRLPPPRYNRSRSIDSIPSQTSKSSSRQRGASAQHSQQILHRQARCKYDYTTSLDHYYK